MMPEKLSWSMRKGLQFVAIIFVFLVMNWVAPGEIYGFTAYDMFTFWAIIGLITIYTFTIYSYFYSPQIWTESFEKVHSSGNEIYGPVSSEDSRLPPFLMMPFGGHKTQIVFVGGGDLGAGGGALFAPHYMVERMEQHLIVHGKPLALSTDAVESNRWMYEFLTNNFEKYVHGSTGVWMAVWGEGPPLDLSHDPKAKFSDATVHGMLQDFAGSLREMAGQARSEMKGGLDLLEYARKRPEIEKLLLEQQKLKSEKEGRTDEK